MSDDCTPRCREIANYILNQTFASIVNESCRVMDLAVNLDDDTAGGTYYVWVFDQNFANAAAVPTGQAPIFPPMAVDPGEVAGWVPPQGKWSPMSGGLSVGISTSDTVFTDAAVSFGVYFHVSTGAMEV
jgi:hypothetical protein